MIVKDVLAMFLTPLYVFSYEHHKDLKEQTLEFLKDEKVFEDYSPSSHIKLSHPNLHKEEIFRPYYYFMYECLNYAMDDMGYTQGQSITAMWATKQERGMYHHPHKHGNSFLAGTYYLHAGSVAFGTQFFNTDNLLQISPNRNLSKPARLNPTFNTPFTEGDFIVFPAWTLHSTVPNMDEEARITLGINSMPVGKTVDEPYDRFNYPDASRLNLDFDENELRRYNRKGPK